MEARRRRGFPLLYIMRTNIPKPEAPGCGRGPSALPYACIEVRVIDNGLVSPRAAMGGS